MRRIEEVKLECSLRSRWQGNYAALNGSSNYENFAWGVLHGKARQVKCEQFGSSRHRL